MSRLKNLALVIAVIGTTTSYFYKKHQYDKELMDRMNYVMIEISQGKRELSGVYLQQRQPFSFLWCVQWLLPYHQSLKIIQKDGTIRNVVLSRNPNPKSFADLTSEFVLHEGEKYDGLNQSEMSYPIECWVDYYRKYDHYPENIDIQLLKEITITRSETTDLSKLFQTTFGFPLIDDTGHWRFQSCRSAVMDALRTHEKIKNGIE